MTVQELNLGDVFRVAGEAQLWRKEAQGLASPVDPKSHKFVNITAFHDKEIEVVERTADIRRSGHTLILRGGEVTLQYKFPWQIHLCTPGDPLTEFVLSGTTFATSRGERPTAETALAFSISGGAKHLGRPMSSELFAYGGRVYARATNKEVLGKAQIGGYKRMRTIDGAKRLVIVGLLTVPSEFALHDIMMEHFGPDTVSGA